jgi:hypothetical protein
LIAVIFGILGVKKAEVRPILVGSIFGFCAALTTVSIYPNVTGPLKDAVRRYEFLIAATEFRHRCRPEEVLVYDAPDEWSPVIFCTRPDFPEGWSSLTEFKIWETGSVRHNGLPRIYSGKPLL